MTAEQVVDIYKSLEEQGILIWIDGGWAVDALLEEQTRSHQDLDIAAQRKDLEDMEALLTTQGFVLVSRKEEEMWDLVLADQAGREIEVHAFTFNVNGDVVEEEHWNGYSAQSLTGKGKILDVEVRSVSLEQLIKTHDKSKRTLKATDIADMKLLQERFGVVFP